MQRIRQSRVALAYERRGRASEVAKFLLLTALLIAVCVDDARADRKTVCTITVNSSDEKETFRRNLPPDRFQFVELVERGRPDWLASACRQGVRCDVLVISGHYDGGKEFYSSRLDTAEFLPVEEMERVSCSDSCRGLFSQLKEVYLFGCNTLNPEARRSLSTEIGPYLARAGLNRADAERVSRELSARYAESSRDRMRIIFKDVPVIYGFSAKAPVGPAAAPTLARYFQSGSAEIGSGRASARLLAQFGGKSMVIASGLSESDALAAHRRDVCQFSDERLSAAQKLAFVHQLLHRDMAEVRVFLDRIEAYAAALSEADRLAPAVSQQLDEIARDQEARGRYLEFAREIDPPAVRARMIQLAGRLGWLSTDDQRAELVRMINDRLARNAVGAAEVDLVCALNQDGELDADIGRVDPPSPRADRIAHAGILACLGGAEARASVLLALTSPKEEEAHIAQAYLRHRAITDVDELRLVTAGIARATDSRAQVRALDTLASQRLADPESLEELTRLLPVAESASVQVAIAGVLLRSDYEVIATPEVVRTLRQSRLKAADRPELIDALLRRLETL
jgi:hypothetical protein